MTNPVITDAVENSFVPLLVINNKGGEDAKILKKYNEPAWNYQVIRFLTDSGKDIIPRRDGISTQHALSTRMVQALEKSNQPVPESLKLLTLSTDTSKLEKVAFSCSCYWTGEYRLGAVPGVISTEAGWIDGHEVTLVTYHKDHLKLADLIKTARKHHVADRTYLSNEQQRKEAAKVIDTTYELKGYRKARTSDQKKQISGTTFAARAKELQLSLEQETKVNAFCRSDHNKALSYLTKKQRDILTQ